MQEQSAGVMSSKPNSNRHAGEGTTLSKVLEQDYLLLLRGGLLSPQWPHLCTSGCMGTQLRLIIASAVCSTSSVAILSM